MHYQWVCDNCGAQMNLEFSAGGTEVVQTPTGRRCERTLALLRVVGAPHVMLIHQGVAWDGDLDSSDYYYNEHTCPTNITRTEAVIANGDTDPHGIFELVVEHCITGPGARDREEVMLELLDMAEAATRMANASLSGGRQ